MSHRNNVRNQLAGVVSRASALVEEETRALQEYRQADYSGFVTRKDMIAFELSAIANMAAGIAPDDELRRQFEHLSVKLEENRKLLQVHIGASKQIAQMLADVVRAGESDGTYCVRRSKGGKSL